MAKLAEKMPMEMTPPLSQGKRIGLDRAFRVQLANKAFKWFCLFSAFIVCIVLFSIIFFIGKTGVLTFTEVSLMEYFFSTDWYPEEGFYGAATLIIGTLALTALTLVMAAPISICMAVFLSEVAPSWVQRFMRPVLDLLVGIPSIVYGYLGLTILLPFLREVTGSNMGDGLLAAAIVLTIMVLPTITRIADDAITFVPNYLREAAYALGSTRLQVIGRILIPSSKKGILTAIILGMARAIGETMAVVMVIGNTVQLPSDLVTPTAVLTSNIVMQITNVPFDSTWNYGLYMMAFLLLLISLFLIAIIRIISAKGETSA